MSIADIAQDLEAAEWQRNNRVRERFDDFTPDDPAYGPAECDDCLIEMPPERRARGRRLCTGCASAMEKRARMFARA